MLELEIFEYAMCKVRLCWLVSLKVSELVYVGSIRWGIGFLEISPKPIQYRLY